MSIRFKILDGTRPANAPRLCDSCQYSVVMRGVRDSEQIVHCTYMRRAVGIQVTECNRYTEGYAPSLWDMRQIAWLLHTDSKRQKIGFLKASAWQEAHEDEELLPDYVNQGAPGQNN